MRAAFFGASLVLAGCGMTLQGQDYAWKGTEWLKLGVTTSDEVVAALGVPAFRGSTLSNGRIISVLVYRHQTAISVKGSFDRSACLYFADEKLVGYLHKSTVWGSQTNFNEERARAFSKSGATRAEVERTLGRANGMAVFPFAESAEVTELRYSYAGPEGFIVRNVAKDAFFTFDRRDGLLDVTVSVEPWGGKKKSTKWGSCEQGI